MPWSASSLRFERQWLVLGPVSGQGGGEILARVLTDNAQPGAEISLDGHAPLRWLPRASWANVVDLSDVFAVDSNTPRHAYARVAIHRAEAGPADVLLGFDGAVALWVNGRPVYEAEAPVGFAADRQRVAVDFRAGLNAVILRLTEDDGPCRFALRVVETGTVVDSDAAPAPAVISVERGKLVVRTDVREDADGQVEVTVLAPGGRIVARASAPGGEDVSFATETWAEGPYDLRFMAVDAWGRPAETFLPWFQGDIVAAARRVLATEAPSGAEPGAATRRMLRRLMEERIKTSPRDALARLQAPLFELAELELEAAGVAARLRPGGFVRLAWIDEVDGSPQFCRAYAPSNYEAGRTWPLVINLHGFNPSNPPYTQFWSVDQRHNALAAKHDVIVLEPHGRGNTQYLGIGERDVMRALAEARRRFNVDEDRVYLMGNSMGGSGTWLLGSRHAGTFAALAPISGGWDQRVAPPAGGPPPPPPAREAWEHFRFEQASSFQSVENLRNVPVFAHHGDADVAVSVENSRHIVGLLQRWGYDLRYRELPGFGHEDLEVDDDIVAWLLRQRRNSAPRHVRVRATDLRGARAHWLQVEGFAEPMRAMHAEATWLAPGRLRLDTDNVTTVRLAPPASLLDADHLETLNVVWNGTSETVPVRDDGVVLSRRDTREERIWKRPGLEGPVADLMRTPFIVVVGTASSDPLMRERCRAKAEAFRALWSAWQHHEPRVRDDVDLTAQDETAFSLLLVGGADANHVTRKIGDRVPLAVDGRGVTIDGRHWPASDAVVELTHPSPFNAERYVVVVAATSADGMYFWNPLWWSLPFGFPTAVWDWTIQDGRRMVLEAGERPEKGWVAAGVFDAGWRRDDRWTVEGNPSLRASAVLRRPPAPGYRAPAAALDACVGSYEVVPGVGAVVVRSADALSISIMGAPAIPLVAESETEFANAGTAAPVVFQRTSSGDVESLTLFNGGQATVWRKTR